MYYGKATGTQSMILISQRADMNSEDKNYPVIGGESMASFTKKVDYIWHIL